MIFSLLLAVAMHRLETNILEDVEMYSLMQILNFNFAFQEQILWPPTCMKIKMVKK